MEGHMIHALLYVDEATVEGTSQNTDFMSFPAEKPLLFPLNLWPMLLVLFRYCYKIPLVSNI